MSEETGKKIEMTQAAWHNEAIKRFGPDESKWRFVCPLCGHVAAVEDYRKHKDKGAQPHSAYQECIGRYEGAGGLLEDKVPCPCDYAGYGLIRLSPIIVTLPDGKTTESFAIAEPEA